MATLSDLLKDPNVTPAQLEEHLDSLPHTARLAQTQALGGKDQDRLWEVAGIANKPFGLDFIVPAEGLEREPFPFVGKNSLPAFTHFRKVFFRQSSGEIGGYNNTSIEKITGPGYYVAEETPDGPGPVLVNYLRIPAEKPESWPEIRPNEQGLSRFIYCGTNDYLRYVSKDVLIGRAYRRKGDTITPMPNWFVLCRQIPQE